MRTVRASTLVSLEPPLTPTGSAIGLGHPDGNLLKGTRRSSRTRSYASRLNLGPRPTANRNKISARTHQPDARAWSLISLPSAVCRHIF